MMCRIHLAPRSDRRMVTSESAVPNTVVPPDA